MGIFSHKLPLVKLILVIRKLLPEPQLPKRRGRPFIYSLPVMMCCFAIMVTKNLSVQGLWKFLTRHDPDAEEICNVINFPGHSIPNRRTFDRRLKAWQESAGLYIQSATVWFVLHKLIGIARLAVDRKMFQAFGKLWHAKDKKTGRIPQGVRNIDKTASWEKSYYRGWVFGHGLDVFVTIGKLILPVLASACSLSVHENVVARALVVQLPFVKNGAVGGDSAYEDQEFTKQASLTGRSLQSAGKRGKIPHGKTYKRRKVAVEPFFERLMLAFPHLRHKLPLKGENRVAGYLLTAVFAYQCAVILNILEKKPPLEVTHFFHFL